MFYLIENRMTETGGMLGSSGSYNPSFSVPRVLGEDGKTRYCWPWPNGMRKPVMHNQNDKRVLSREDYALSYGKLNNKTIAYPYYPGGIFSPIPFFMDGKTADSGWLSRENFTVPYPGALILSRNACDRISIRNPGLRFKYIETAVPGARQLSPEFPVFIADKREFMTVDGKYVDTSSKEKRRSVLEFLKQKAEESDVACFASFASSQCFFREPVIEYLQSRETSVLYHFIKFDDYISSTY